MKSRAAVTVLLCALGAAPPRLLVVRAAIVRAAVMGVPTSCFAMFTSATGTTRHWARMVRLIVVAAAAAARAVAAALAKEFLLVKDAAALADLLMLRLPHQRIPGNAHVALPLRLCDLGSGWGGAEMKNGRTRWHSLIRRTGGLLPSHRESLHR